MVDEVKPKGRVHVESLDDPLLYPETDPSGLRHRLRGFPLQCRQAWQEALTFELPLEYGRAKQIVVVGMGGSAIGGDLLADLAYLEDSPPITVCRDYQIPDHVGEDTLVLACSYSGETEETLSAFRQALSRGAKLVALTTGGTLAAEAEKHGLPVFRVGYDGEPRTAMGYGFMVPTVILMNLGLISDKTPDVEEALTVLDSLAAECAEDSPINKNPAKSMAGELLGRLIIVYGAGVFGGVARRWKTQFNENSKVWACYELLPEAHHNSVEGYPLPVEIKGRAFVILLWPGYLHPRTHLRYEVTLDLLARESIPQRTVKGRGQTALSQILSTTLLGDYTSYYLALLQGLDPSPVTAIDLVKKRLAGPG